MTVDEDGHSTAATPRRSPLRREADRNRFAVHELRNPLAEPMLLAMNQPMNGPSTRATMPSSSAFEQEDQMICRVLAPRLRSTAMSVRCFSSDCCAFIVMK